MTDSSSTTAMPDALAHAAFAAARAPGWLRTATAEQRKQLHRLSITAERARQGLKTASAALPELQAFALDLLRSDLASVPGPPMDPARAMLCWVDPAGKQDPVQHTLLDAALLNFHARDIEASAYAQGSGLFAGVTKDGKVDTSRPLPLTAPDFAKRCRALDIGGRFQRALAEHIPSRLPSSHDAVPSSPSLAWHVYDTQRKAFAADACAAWLSGALGSEGRALLANWGLSPVVPVATAPATANRLELLGFPICSVMVVQAQGSHSTPQPVVAYIPGDPEGSVVQYPHAQAFTIALGTRLRKPDYRKLFASFVPLSQRLEFLEALETAVSRDGWLPAHLSWRSVPLAGDPFVEGYRIWATQTFEDAALVAVPTAQLDHRDTVERYAHWVEVGEKLGISLALLVGSTLPGINLVVEAIVLSQSVYSVFEGVKAWREGDSQAALDYLFGAVENAAFVGLGKRPQPTTAAVDFGRTLVPVTDADGQVRLWQPDLDDFRARDVPPDTVEPDGAGMYRYINRNWVRMNERMHEINAASSSSHAPLLGGRENGYAPALIGDGLGGWRAPHERPASWSGAQLVRRFNARYETLPSATVLEAQRLAGITDAQLRRAHLDGTGIPAPLGRLLRLRLAEHEVSRTLNALRTTYRLGRVPAPLVEALQKLPGWPADQALEYRTGEVSQVFGSDDAANRVQLTEAMLSDGTWPASLIDQMGAEAASTLLNIRAPFVQPDQVHEALARQWASKIETDQAALVRKLITDPPAADPAARLLLHRFPGMTTEGLNAVLRDCSPAERQLIADGHPTIHVSLPAIESSRQWRLTLALDDLAQGRFSRDRERLVMGLWAKLGQWAQGMRLELREGRFEGALLGQAGGADAPRWVIVRIGERYKAYDDQGLELSPPTSLEDALAAAVPDNLRTAFRAQAAGTGGLRRLFTTTALANRSTLRPMLRLVSENQPFMRPPARQANGSIGYALSGRGRWPGGAERTLHPYLIALRALYPEVSSVELAELRAGLGEGEAATTALAALNADFARLRLELQTWVRNAADVVAEHALHEQENREAISREIVRLWQRRESTNGHGGLGYGLDLRGRDIRELPTLSVRFPHVRRLALVDMNLSRVNDGFLSSFPNIELLDLSFNRLTELPVGLNQFSRLNRLRLDYTGLRTMAEVVDAVGSLSGTLEHLALAGNGINLSASDFGRLAELPRLASLGLEDNTITLTADTVGGFNQLTQLEELTLSTNPLTRAPRVNDMVNLAWLDVSQGELTQFPPGLEELMDQDPLRLREIDLSQNEISQVPDLEHTRYVRESREARDNVEAPLYGMSINLDGNPLTEESRAILRRSSIQYFEAVDSDGPVGERDPDQWLEACPEDLAASVRLERAEHEARDFYDLLSRVTETADYIRDPAGTLRRAWDLVGTWLRSGETARPGIEALRERLFAMARDTQGTCGDGVALTLDEMEFEVQAWSTVADAQGGGDGPLRALLGFQRGLWRRALVDDLARRITRARVARRAGLDTPDTAPALDPLDDLADDQLDNGLDEVEVRFYLFQKLEGVLGLPPGRQMRYTTRVSGETAQRVGVQVLQRDTDTAFAAWVAERPSFRLYLENGRSALFEPVRERWQDAAGYLYSISGDNSGEHSPVPDSLQGLREGVPDLQWEAGQPLPALTDQQLRLAYDWVSQQRERELDALALRLTRQLLGLERANTAGTSG